jgi:hypothetical protein
MVQARLSDASEELYDEDELTLEPVPEPVPESVPEPPDAEVTDAAPADPDAALSPESLGLGTGSFFTRVEALGELRAAMDALQMTPLPAVPAATPLPLSRGAD